MKEKFDRECTLSSTYKACYTIYVGHQVGLYNQTLFISLIDKFSATYGSDPFVKRVVEAIFGVTILEGMLIFTNEAKTISIE